MITATCHCGAVRLEMDFPPTMVTDCNCSICRRYGARWAYYTRTEARVVSHQDMTSFYVWGDRCIEFHRCNACGCVTHYEGVDDKSETGRLAVNARMMDPNDIANASIRKFDGADTWKTIEIIPPGAIHPS